MKLAGVILALTFAGLFGLLALQAEPVTGTLGWIAATFLALSGLVAALKRD